MVTLFNVVMHLIRLLYLITFGWLIIICIIIAIISKDVLTVTVATYLTSGYIYTIVFFNNYYRKQWEDRGTFWKSIIHLILEK